jgi:2-furoyl-CoA dehydrogenase FAD binding subunit
VKPVAFEYCRPETLDEALALLAEFGDDASVLSGGLSLMAMLNMRLVQPQAVIDVNRVPGLDGIEVVNGTVRTGALTRQADALAAPELASQVPLLARALPHVGHYQTRGRGTLGGSVAHADPSAEVPLCLATLGGEVALSSSAGTRHLAAADFFQGALTTAREPDELVTALFWPRLDRGHGVAFDEIAQRAGDFALAAAAAVARLDADGRIGHLALGFGGVAECPTVVDTSPFLGAPANEATAREIAETAAASIEAMTDRAASADYRRQLARVLGARVLEQAFHAAGEG